MRLLHADTLDVAVWMATPDQFYGIIQASASAPAGTGAAWVNIFTKPGCDYVGSTVGTTPAVGTIVYAQNNRLPGPGPTSMQPGAPGFYIVGALGEATPWIDPPAPCKIPAFPLELDTLTMLGPVTFEADVFLDMSLFIGP